MKTIILAPLERSHSKNQLIIDGGFVKNYFFLRCLSALRNRKACLVANHGMVSIGKTLKEAFDLAVEVENLAKQYWKILLSGRAKLLSISQMQTVLKKFKSYGKQKIDR